MNRNKRQEIFSRLRAGNPHPATELKYCNPFQLLIAVILSAQSTDVGVNKATLPLFKKAKTAAAMLKLGEAGLKDYIKTIGLFNTKAKNIIKTCSMLVEQHGGKVPEERAALEALPGVGRKTANVVLNTADTRLGFLIAGVNVINARQRKRHEVAVTPAIQGSRA